MQRRRLGQLEVSAVGLDCGTMTPLYGEPDSAAGIATIRHRRAPRCQFGGSRPSQPQADESVSQNRPDLRWLRMAPIGTVTKTL